MVDPYGVTILSIFLSPALRLMLRDNELVWINEPIFQILAPPSPNTSIEKLTLWVQWIHLFSNKQWLTNIRIRNISVIDTWLRKTTEFSAVMMKEMSDVSFWVELQPLLPLIQREKKTKIILQRLMSNNQGQIIYNWPFTL